MTEETWPEERVSKLDAARRQLRTAIRLFFEEGDSVSIHTLAAASHEMLRSLVKREGGASMIKDSDFIRPERQNEFNRLMNEPQNFFKHADRDPYETLNFKARETAFWICDCIMMDRKHSAGPFPVVEFQAFIVWFTIEYPHLLTEHAATLLPDAMKTEMGKIKISGRAKELCLNLIKRQSGDVL